MTTSGNTSHPSLSHTDSIAASSSDFLLLVGRVLLGWLFLASGYGKFGNIAGTTAYFTSLGGRHQNCGPGLRPLQKSFLALA